MSYHPNLSKLGLTPSTAFMAESQGLAGESQWNRLWIVVKEVEVRTFSKNETKYVEIGDIKMKVEAR